MFFFAINSIKAIYLFLQSIQNKTFIFKEMTGTTNNCKQCTNDFQGGGKDFLVLFVLVDNFEVVVTLDTFTVQQPRDIFLAARGESAHESQFCQAQPFRRL